MNRLLFALVAVASSSCALFSSSLAPIERTLAEALISDEQETQLGLQVHQELTKENVRFSTHARVNSYVQGLVAKLTPTADKERKLAWQLFVIDDPKSVNAFATPGGRIYVYTGLLLAAQNEAQVVGVMGHEMGHVVARHSARQLVTAKGLEVVAGMALGQQPNEVAALAAGLLGNGTMLAYGREMENEADEFGVRYAHYADYDPGALAGFFEMLTAQKGDTQGILVYLSTHPSNADRIAHIRQFMANGGFKGSVVGPERLAPIQAEIRAMPAAVAPVAQPAAPATQSSSQPSTASPTPPAQQPAPSVKRAPPVGAK